jgi:hypothetical protein
MHTFTKLYDARKGKLFTNKRGDSLIFTDGLGKAQHSSLKIKTHILL